MKIIRNDKGYTLILTLLIVIIIVSLFSTFAFGAITQQKQVEITDDKYEVVAIAEMGVEYYRAEIINLIEKKRKLTEFNKAEVEEDENLTETEKYNIIKEINKTNLEQLRDEVEEIPIGPTKNTTLENSKIKSFKLVGQPSFSVESPEELTIIVEGKLEEKYKKIFVKFNFPTNLVISKPITTGDGNSYDEGNNTGETVQGKLFIPTDFSKTIPEPFPPPETPSCHPPLKGKTCHTRSLGDKDIDLLNNSIVYYSGNASFSNGNNDDYYLSKLYVNGNLDLGNLNSNVNISFYVKGKATFQNMNNSNNVFIQSTEGAIFNNLNNINGLKINLKGSGEFENIGGQDLSLYGEGSYSFGNINNLKNSKIEIIGSTQLKKNASFENSQIHLIGSIQANQLDIQKKSAIYIDSPIHQYNAFRVKENSKVCIGSTYSLGQLDIDSSSNVYILDSRADSIYTIANPINYSLQGGSKKPLYMPTSEYNKVCTIAGGSNTTEPTFEHEVIPSPTIDGFTNAIIYK